MKKAQSPEENPQGELNRTTDAVEEKKPEPIVYLSKVDAQLEWVKTKHKPC